MRWLLVVLGLALVVVSRPASAHGFAPVVAELREREGGVWDAELRGSADREGAFPELVFPATCVTLQATESTAHVRCPTLHGEALAARGLDGSIELLVEVHFADGSSASGSLHHDGERFTIPNGPKMGQGFGSWIAVGARHIAGGLDHLLFVAALFFLVRTRRALVLALTAFTVAHSLTLALGALGIARVPPLLAEAWIALSIVLLAAELARGRTGSTLTARRPWLVAFVFGLLHGAGFARGLEDAGLEREHVVRALFGFNVGVELAQLAFVAALALVVGALRRLAVLAWLTRPRVVGYVSGAVAAAWTIERTLEIVR